MALHSIVITEKIKQFLVEQYNYNDADITVISNGVEIERFVDLEAIAQKEYCNKSIIYTGNFADYQRVDLLFKAFAIVAGQRDNIRLTIVSSFSFEKAIDLAKKHNVLERIDFVKAEFDEVPGYMAKADIAANPRTVCDGLPQKLLNYMAAGMPVVSFEGSGKLLEHGKTGWVVQDDDVKAFAAGMLHLLDNQELSKRIGDNARRYVKSELTWEKAAESIESVYEQVLAS